MLRMTIALNRQAVFDRVRSHLQGIHDYVLPSCWASMLDKMATDWNLQP